MRVQHLLRTATGNAYPSLLSFVDVETVRSPVQGMQRVEVERLSSWVGFGLKGAKGMYPEAHWSEGDAAESYWALMGSLLKRNAVIWCISENASRVFTLLGLWEMLDKRDAFLAGNDPRDSANKAWSKKGRQFGYAILEDPPFCVDVRLAKANGRMRIIDLRNYVAAPSPAEATATDRVKRASEFTIAMIDTMRTNGMGSLKVTAASQAFATFRNSHLTTQVLCHASERVLALEERSYYGGRCECFRIGPLPGPIYHVDVSSMYTSICAETSLPVALCGSEVNPSKERAISLVASRPCLATVTLSTDTADYPYKLSKPSISVWPVGRIRTSLAGPELRDALDRGRLIECHEIAWYESAPVLQSYAKLILRLREQYWHNADLCSWIKSLGVCLVGKLGQRDRSWRDKRSLLFHRPWDYWFQKGPEGEDQRWRAVAGTAQCEEVSGWSNDAVPAIACFVTSAGRLKLLNLMRTAGRANVYYCDTDALMVNADGYQRLVDAGEMDEVQPGKLRVKGVHQSVTLHGLKDYEEDGQIVRAGVPISDGDTTLLDGNVWITPRIASACRSRRQPRPIRVQVSKNRQATYQHGIVIGGGFVTPHKLEE